MLLFQTTICSIPWVPLIKHWNILPYLVPSNCFTSVCSYIICLLTNHHQTLPRSSGEQTCCWVPLSLYLLSLLLFHLDLFYALCPSSSSVLPMRKAGFWSCSPSLCPAGGSRVVQTRNSHPGGTQGLAPLSDTCLGHVPRFQWTTYKRRREREIWITQYIFSSPFLVVSLDYAPPGPSQ